MTAADPVALEATLAEAMERWRHDPECWHQRGKCTCWKADVAAVLAPVVAEQVAAGAAKALVRVPPCPECESGDVPQCTGCGFRREDILLGPPDHAVMLARAEELRGAAEVCAASPNPDWRHVGDFLKARAARVVREGGQT